VLVQPDGELGSAGEPELGQGADRPTRSPQSAAHGGPDLRHTSAAQQLPLRRPADWDAIARDLKPIYTAATAPAAAMARFEEFTEAWASRYPAIVNRWRNVCSEFVPFLDYDVEIRRSSAPRTMGSLNARYRRAVRARGYFPTGQAAPKCSTR
jgi:hypothetical protein